MKRLAEQKRDIPQYVPTWQAWGESILLAAALALPGFLFSPTDPFFAHGGFPWPLLAPLLAGLRHGVSCGVGAAVALVVGMGLAFRHGMMDTFPLPLSLAFLVFGIVGGQFAAMWRRRAQRLVTRLEYHRTRLEEFSRTYHVLRESFEALNRKNLTDPHNLREAIITFRKDLAKGGSPREPFMGLGDEILSLFTDFAQIHAAVLYAVDADGNIGDAPVAGYGTDRQVVAEDPLIAAVVRSRQAQNVASDFRGRERETPWLAAIPLVDVTGRMHGLVAIESMLFSSFQGPVLKRLAVLGGHTADLLAFRGPTATVDDFRQRVRRARVDSKSFGLVSSAVCVHAPKGRVPVELFRILLDKRRGLDGAYHLKHESKGECVFLLLPLTDELGLAGYRERVGTLMGEGKVKAGEEPEIEAFTMNTDADYRTLLDRLDMPFPTLVKGA